MMQEGVTQYRLDWQFQPLENAGLIAELNTWRTRFYDPGGIGQADDRYDGIGFGNVSRRLSANEFLISGTQTGVFRILAHSHYCKVVFCDIKKNYVKAIGPVPPSSEAMTHHMIYALLADVQFVFHLHAPSIWRAAERLKLPRTPPEVGYGTPAMATAVEQIIHSSNATIIVMGGHQDGVIGWGHDADQLGQQLLALYKLADKSLL
ncbi:MAG TPA: class II aldolase/adducin family protein [Pseudomonadales bacterium]|nr:class II aldolase/adducin family protein [Pseudomonadales bacterium]